MTTTTTTAPPHALSSTVLAGAEIGRIVQRHIDLALTPFGFSFPQLQIMALVGERPGVTPGRLAGELLQETHSVSGLLNRLEDRKLIVRAHGKEDRRMVHVRLTEHGAAVLSEAAEATREAQMRILLRLGIHADGHADYMLEARDALLPLVPSHLLKLRDAD